MAAGNGSIASNLPPALQNRGVQIGIVVFLLLLIVGGIFMAVNNSSKSLGEPKTLLKGIDQSRALEIASKLKNNEIQTIIVPAETGGVEIQVMEKQFDLAVMEMAKSDLLYTDDFKLFDKTDWAASDYERRVKYMRAVGGELSRMISRMSGIRWAKVHVNIPPERVFASRYTKDKTSASVNLETEAGHSLTYNQVNSILSIVSGYVPEITPNQISITDTKGRLYSSAVENTDEYGTGMNGGNGAIVQKTEMLSDAIGKRVQYYLDGVFGIGKSKAVVSVRLLAEKTMQNKTNFLPGAVGIQEYSEEALGNAAMNSAYRGADHFVSTDNFAERNMNSQEVNYPQIANQSPNMGSEVHTMVSDQSSMKQTAQESINGQFANNAFQDPLLPQAKELESKEKGQENNVMRSNTMASNIAMNNTIKPLQAEDKTHYTCADNDEDCKRNYRQHNFTIQSYPSFEQTIIESSPGTLKNIKVSVVVQGRLPVPLDQLKASIAAAADPQMTLDDVEIIIKSGNSGNDDDQANSRKKNKNSLLKDLPWWGILLIAIGVIFGFLLLVGLLRTLGSIFTPSRTTPNRNPVRESYNPPPRTQESANSPLTRNNLGGNNTSIQSNNINQPQQQFTNNKAPREEIITEDNTRSYFDENISKDENINKTNAMQENNSKDSKDLNDLPFDLEDEFSLEEEDDDNDEIDSNRQQNMRRESMPVLDDDEQFDIQPTIEKNDSSNVKPQQQPSISKSTSKKKDNKPYISVEYD